jgi:hypothetical protein
VFPTFPQQVFSPENVLAALSEPEPPADLHQKRLIFFLQLHAILACGIIPSPPLLSSLPMRTVNFCPSISFYSLLILIFSLSLAGNANLVLFPL